MEIKIQFKKWYEPNVWVCFFDTCGEYCHANNEVKRDEKSKIIAAVKIMNDFFVVTNS